MTLDAHAPASPLSFRAIAACCIVLGCSGPNPSPVPAAAPAEGAPAASAAPTESAPASGVESVTGGEPVAAEGPAAPATEPAAAAGPVTEGAGAEAAAVPSPLADARAACERGWERFGAGALDEASRELEVAREALRELALQDPEARRVLGACEYNRGRVLEAQNRRDEARRAYERSLLHRENETVLSRWRTLAVEGAAPPSTAPGSLFHAALAERRRICGGEPRRVPYAGGRAHLLRPTCGVAILDVAMDEGERGVAVLQLFSGYDPEEGESSIRWAFPLFVLADGRWRDAGPLFSTGGDTLNRCEVAIELRELTGAPPSELVAEVSYAVSYVPSADDGGATYEGMVVCGRLESPSPACAELRTGGSDSEDDEGEPSFSRVTFEPNGRVVIADHTEGDDGDEVQERETTLDALWAPARR